MPRSDGAAAAKAPNPARLASFRIEIQSPELEERRREGLLRAVKSCLIHNTLTDPPRIETVLRPPVAQPAA